MFLKDDTVKRRAIFISVLEVCKWNFLTGSLIPASECAEDSVTKFTSLV